MSTAPSRPVLALVLALLALACVPLQHAVEYDNTMSRYYLLSAVVDRGTLSIDDYPPTPDSSEHAGHRYSNKAPGLPLVAAPVYALARAVPFTRGDRPLGDLHRAIVRIAIVGIPFVLCGVMLLLLARRLGSSEATGVRTVLAFGLGTIAWVHATLFSGHLTAAACGLGAFVILQRLRRDPDAARAVGWAATAGALAGLGVLMDFMGVVAAGVLTLYAMLSSLRPRAVVAYLCGGLTMAFVLAAYNARCFGSLVALSYGSLADPEFAAGASGGVLGVGAPDLAALAALLGSPSRGLFFLSPVLLLAVAGFVSAWKAGHHRVEIAVCLGVTLGVLLVNAGFYGWHGGWTHGPRYLVAALPFLAVGLLFAPLRGWPFWAALGLSIAQIAPAVAVNPHAPHEIVNPLYEHVLPLMKRGYGAEGLVAVGEGIPWLIVLAVLAWHVVRRASGTVERPGRVVSAVVALALVGIVAGIAIVRSPDGLSQAYRRKQLQDTNDLSREVWLYNLQLHGRGAGQEFGVMGGPNGAGPRER